MSQGINLQKGGRIDLSKEPNLNRVRAELRWSPNETNTGHEFDLDMNIFVCRYDAERKPKLVNDQHFVFYNKLKLDDGSVWRSEDDTTGERGGEDAYVDFTKLNPVIEEIAFIVTIHEADLRRQSFGQVPRCSITLFNDETGDCLGGYQMEEDFSSETAVQFGSLYQTDGKWKFKAVGTGYNLGLAEFVVGYGGNLA